MRRLMPYVMGFFKPKAFAGDHRSGVRRRSSGNCPIYLQRMPGGKSSVMTGKRNCVQVMADTQFRRWAAAAFMTTRVLEE